MPRGKENTQHIASKIAPLLFNGDFKLFSGCALKPHHLLHVVYLVLKTAWEVGEQLHDANVFYVVAPDDHTTPPVSPPLEE